MVKAAAMHGNPALSVAVFGTFLTSMSIIAAFSIEKESRWPTPWEALKRARIPVWFAVGLSSVLTALAAVALDNELVSAVSLALALLAIALGTWCLWELVRLSSEQGRWNLVVDLLARSILEVEPPAHPASADLGEIDTDDHVPASFLNAGEPRQPRRSGVSIGQVPRVLDEYADHRDLGAIVRLVDEVHAGARAALERADSLDFDQYLHTVDALLFVERSVFNELAGRVLAGQLGDATARIAVARAGEAALDTAGRVRRDPGLTGWDPERVERVVARHVTTLARFAGHVAQDVDAQLGLAASSVATTERRSGLLALRSAAVALQQAGRWAVDPNPPGMKLPGEHPWRLGFSSPEAVLIWLWSTVESASGPFGVGLYASCQILTGDWFWESFWDGYDVFTEISRRLADPVTPESGRAAELMSRCGGFELVTLELGARRLAALPPRQSGPPACEDDPSRLDDRHVACNLFLAAAGFKPPGRDPVADLAQLLTDRTGGSLWTMVLEELRQLPDEVVPPPLQPLYRRPEACALAVCLRLAPLAEEPDPEELAPLQEFISLLPDPLLERTAELGGALTSSELFEGNRAAQEGRLIRAARFARLIAPGELPRSKAVGEPSRRPRPPLPAELADRNVEEALEQIAGAESELWVDLFQRDPRWLDEWAEVRSALDAELLAGALRGTVRVRRVILFNLPGEPPPETTRLHYRWTESLAAATNCFSRNEHSPYQVRQVLASRFGEELDRLPESISIRSSGEGYSTWFDTFWPHPESGLFEL
ncbi:MAG: hypothetical protein ACTHN3_12380 [Solirubrobacterales bacterium]